MAIATTNREQCFLCEKEKITYKCEGCSNVFCIDDLLKHRQTLNKQLNEIENDRNVFLQTLIQQKENTKKHPLIQQIDEWEEDSINKIKQRAEECREILIILINKSIVELENQLINITKQLKQIHQDNDFNEIDLNYLKEMLKKLGEKLDEPSNISIEQQSISFIDKIFIIRPFVPLRGSLTDIPLNSTWNKNGQTVARRNSLLSNPHGLYVDDDQTVYVADWANHRILAWKSGEINGHIVAGGHGQGNGTHQLNWPTDMIVDKERDSLIICDYGNKRVVRWPRKNGTNGETIISNIYCCGITMDENGSLYVTDLNKHEVKRYEMDDLQGIVVAGGNGRGDRLDQLDGPTYIFVDREHSIFVSDWRNQRVMKWTEGAKEGIVVAGDQGKGSNLSQLSNPNGVLVDQLGAVYIADAGNNRIVRWRKGAKQGDIVVGGNGPGAQANQLDYPEGLSFDRHGHLYAINRKINQVQRFTMHTPWNQ